MVHLGVNLCADTKTPLAIIAAGTGNDIARGLGLPVHDPIAAADVVGSGIPREIDVVRHVDARGDVRWFAGVLGAGFDSLVNERANTWPWPKGRMRYNLAIARELPGFRAIPYAVTVDGVRHETAAMLVTVGNGQSYGGGMRVAPHASFHDGLVDVMVLHEISTVEFLKVFPKVFKGNHITHPAVQIVKGRQVTLEADGIIAYADGERFAPLPLTLETVPAAVTVLAPARGLST
jgi:diacylglycerol kinase (ATP)